MNPADATDSSNTSWRRRPRDQPGGPLARVGTGGTARRFRRDDDGKGGAPACGDGGGLGITHAISLPMAGTIRLAEAEIGATFEIEVGMSNS